MAIEPVLTVRIRVEAYYDSGWGDNRSRDFPGDQQDEAVRYARSLPPGFNPSVRKEITMRPIYIPIDHMAPDSCS